jgi:processive rubber oxygenase RoxA-like protein/cytochrome c3-like protein
MEESSRRATSGRVHWLHLVAALPVVLAGGIIYTRTADRVERREILFGYLGPTHPQNWLDPNSPRISTNAQQYSVLFGLRFRDDVDLSIHDVPVDLDLDGKPDVIVNKELHLKGGILGNPRVFGLTPAPDDPAGTVGEYSISTGFLGVREEKDPATGRGTGRYGFNCVFCHGGTNPTTGEPVPGLQNAKLDYGLMFATSKALDDDFAIDMDGDGKPDSEDVIRRRNRLAPDLRLDLDGDGIVTTAEFRRAKNFESASLVRARLVLQGPGRQDVTTEFSADASAPGSERLAYESGIPRWLMPKNPPVFNPVSLPGHMGVRGLDHLNWSGNDSAIDYDWFGWYQSASGLDEAAAYRSLGIPAGDRRLAARAINLDRRNVETFGITADSPDAMQWSDNLSHADPLTPEGPLPPKRFLEIPEEFRAHELRDILWQTDVPDALVRKDLDAERVRRGAEIFSNEIVGTILNQQVLLYVPDRWKSSSPAPPIVAPIDIGRSVDEKIEVACATCHNYSPSDRKVPLSEFPHMANRCMECHRSHPPVGAKRESPMSGLRPGDALPCRQCHEEHRDFGPWSGSRSLLLPFDADGDGVIKADEADDGAAGGIGTDSMYAVTAIPKLPFAVVRDARRPGRFETVERAFGWIRVAPLRACWATAPYLHDGSVPTLEALLEHPKNRPVTFAVGNPEQEFVLDTRLPGNRNTGHDFGGDLSPEKKRDLVEFLKSL